LKGGIDMPWCPKCKSEYRDGFLKCAGCDEPLIEKPYPSETVEYETGVKWVYLTDVADEHEADLVESVLRTEAIPVMRKHREGGDYMAVYMGISKFGIDLLVPEGKLDAAWGLLHGERLDMPEENPEDNTVEQEQKYQVKRKSIVWLILLYLLFPIIAALILNNLFK